MNKNLGIMLGAAAITIAGCNSGEQNIKKQMDVTSQEIESVFSDVEEKDELTINYDDVVDMTEPPYKALIQELDSPIVSGDVFKSEIAITIDDGNGAKNIDAILDTLAKYDVKATFFIVGTRIRMHSDQRRRALDEGHQICNHTYDHHYFRNVDSNLLEQQILDWEAAVRDCLGDEYLDSLKTNFPFFRFPGGCGDAKPEHLAVLRKYGYLPIGWSDDRWKSGKQLNNGEIELFHFKPQDFDRISGCIQEALSQGFECKQMTDIVNPDEGYDTPITRNNLRSMRRDANKLMDSWDNDTNTFDDTIQQGDSLPWDDEGIL